MRTVWKVRLVVSTVLGLIALYGIVDRALAVTLPPTQWNMVGYYTSSQFGSGAPSTVNGRQVFKVAAAGVAATYNAETGYGGLASGAIWTPQTAVPSLPATSVATAMGYVGQFSLRTEPKFATDPWTTWRIYHWPTNMGFNATIGGVNRGRGFSSNRTVPANNYSSFTFQRLNPLSSIACGEAYTDEAGSQVSGHLMVAALYANGYWSWRIQVRDTISLKPEGTLEELQYSEVGTGTVLPSIVHSVQTASNWQQVKVAPAQNPPDNETFITGTVSATGNDGIYLSFDRSAVEALYTSMGGIVPVDSLGVMPPVDRSVVDTDTTAPSVPGGLSSWLQDKMFDPLQNAAAAILDMFWIFRVFGGGQ